MHPLEHYRSGKRGASLLHFVESTKLSRDGAPLSGRSLLYTVALYLRENVDILGMKFKKFNSSSWPLICKVVSEKSC